MLPIRCRRIQEYRKWGDLVASSSSEELRDVVRESFFVGVRGTGSTADYRLDVAYLLIKLGSGAPVMSSTKSM
jgi:hypothetical protein